MSDASMKPSWKSSNDVIANVDWANLQAWKDIYIWDRRTISSFYEYSQEPRIHPSDFNDLRLSISGDPISSIASGYLDGYYSGSALACNLTFTIYSQCEQTDANSIKLFDKQNSYTFSVNNLPHTLIQGSARTFVITDDSFTIQKGQYLVAGNHPDNYTITNPTKDSIDNVEKNIYVYTSSSATRLYLVIAWDLDSGEYRFHTELATQTEQYQARGFETILAGSINYSSGGWQTEIASASPVGYSHGRQGTTGWMNLRRGSLYDNIFGQLKFSRVGNGRLSFDLNFQNSESKTVIPRYIKYGAIAPGGFSSQLREIDTFLLQTNDLETDASWVNNNCNQIRITLNTTTAVENLNRLNTTYYYYGYN